MKQCTNCRQWKPVEAFGVASARTDGRHPWCRSCKAFLEKERRRARTKTERERDNRRHRWRQHIVPESGAARVALARAVQKGSVVKAAKCERCGAAGIRLEGHHHKGYARGYWLDVQWLCRSCHKLEHAWDVPRHVLDLSKNPPRRSSRPCKCPICREKATEPRT